MPWKEWSTMCQRNEFVRLAKADEANVAALCRQFGISRKSGYKWIARAKEGDGGLADHSRRPLHSPRQSKPGLEQRVIELRQKHPRWGGRKIARQLLNQGATPPCAPSTVTEILHRHGLIDLAESQKRQPFTRFEHPQPNDLWQMDFKGHFALTDGSRCHPLTVLDDHSRYAIVLQACSNEQTLTVKTHLTHAFRHHGLPRRMLCDNGSPWGTCGSGEVHTPLTLWLLRLGVGVSHGRACHPQTQGKDERFHRTVKEEVLAGREFDDEQAAQAAFDPWRGVYNHERPHEGIDLAVPASRYKPSCRAFPEQLPPLEYPAGDLVRRVGGNASIGLHRQRYMIGKAFRGAAIGMRSTGIDGVWDVYYAHEQIGQIDEREQGGSMCRDADEWVKPEATSAAEAVG